MELGGNPNVLIHHPSITRFKIDDESDFILIGCINGDFVVFPGNCYTQQSYDVLKPFFITVIISWGG